MYDINFFNHYKRSKSKNKSFILFLVLFLVVVVLLNGALIGGGLYLFRGLEGEIASMRNYINNPATQQAMAEASQIRSEADLTAKYLGLLKSVDERLDQMDQIDSQLLMNISRITPDDVTFRSAQISGINVSLTCESITPTAPMDMYHAFIESPLFSDVVMSGIAIGDTGSSFALNFVIVQAGGEQS